MTRTRLQSLGQGAPLPPFSPPPLPPPSPRRVEMPTVGGVAAAFACRFAALQLSASYHFRMNAFTPSSTPPYYYTDMIIRLPGDIVSEYKNKYEHVRTGLLKSCTPRIIG